MNKVTQTKENRDKVREGVMLTDLYRQIERSYHRYGLPGVAITMNAREQALISDVDDLHEKVDGIAGMARILLAFRVEQDGHAEKLGDAIKIAGDRDRMTELYPELTAWAWADKADDDAS